jgi:hypothetical protein
VIALFRIAQNRSHGLVALLLAVAACGGKGAAPSSDTAASSGAGADSGASSGAGANGGAGGSGAGPASAGSGNGGSIVHAPGDERLLYANGDGAIVSSFTDGTDAHVISPAGWRCKTPAWSPDGKRVAFSTDHSGNPELYVMGADGSSPTLVFPWDVRMFDDVSNPSWSSKGLLAFEAFENYSAGPITSTWTVAVDGTGLISVGVGGKDAGAPAWSPAGLSLALHSDGFLWVWRSQNDASQVTQGALFAQPLPTWTPAGDAILYTLSDSGGGTFSVHRVHPDGSSDTVIATPSDAVGRPSVSRDGKTIAFDLTQSDPYLVEVDTLPIGGGAPARLVLDASDPQYQR